MKIGKVSETILKRSILKEVHTLRDEVLVGAAVGEDCAMIELKDGEVFVLSTDPITGTTKDIGKLSINVTLNDIASAGAEPVGVLLSVLLPPTVTEEDIKVMMHDVCEECSALNVQVVGGHTEVTEAVRQPIITVTGVGKVKKGEEIVTGGTKPGDDIIVTKWIGLEGSSIIAKEKSEELKARFSENYIAKARDFDRYISVVEDAGVALKAGVHAMHDVTEGGIFGALWELSESAGVGLDIDLKAIPIKQETVEICNFFDINPYQLISSGSMLMASADGEAVVKALQDAGIHASVIGRATNSNDRTVSNGDEKRFLTPPETDELYKIYLRRELQEEE
ncbi:MAG: AIR synthase family protein [Lachnospiraceae bacterium]|nr:AIR synthase family protein [Lachnospiraceae bacterium]